MLKSGWLRAFVIGAAVLMLSAAPARAALFTYSFDMTAGPVLGTVNGTIDLPFVAPGGSGTGAASLVTIDSFPAGIGVLPQGPTPTTWSNQLLNSFTVTAGVITAYAFSALDGPGLTSNYEICFNSGPSASIGSRVCLTNLNFLGLGESTNFGYNFDGPAGITFSEASVPEPTSLALFGAGLAGLAAARRRRTN